MIMLFLHDYNIRWSAKSFDCGLAAGGTPVMEGERAGIAHGVIVVVLTPAKSFVGSHARAVYHHRLPHCRIIRFVRPRTQSKDSKGYWGAAKVADPRRRWVCTTG